MNRILGAAFFLVAIGLGEPQQAGDRVMTSAGQIEGAGATDGIRSFKGIPFAAPPVGPLRWQPPQPAEEVGGRPSSRPHSATQCMQRRMFGDMIFRAAGMSEDCLYLNVWTPATRASRAAAGARLLLRRRLHRRRRLGAALRRRRTGAARHRRPDGELPPRCVRLLRASRADEGVAAQRVGQLRPARPGRRRCSGCGTTSPRSAATRGESRSPASRPARSRSARRWRRRCRRA